MALQQKYLEYRIRKLLKLLLPGSCRVLVINTSHGVLTDVAQAASLKQEDQGIFIKQVETVINQGEGVMVGINGQITYRKSSQGNY